MSFIRKILHSLNLHPLKLQKRWRSLSQILHIIRGDVTDLQELLQYLVQVHKRVMVLSRDRYDPLDTESIEDSFAYLTSKTDTLKVWVVNYAERTGIRINLFFNLSTQSDHLFNNLMEPSDSLASAW